MISLGIKNKLTALRHTSVGMFLGDDFGYDVLLPNKYVADDLKEGDVIEVFIYKDSEDRIVATTLEPALKLNEFAYLQVTSLSPFGAFVNWGLEKDLLIPFREQAEPLKVGQWATIGLLLDLDTERLVGSSKVNRFLEYETIDLKVDQEVDVLVYERSDLGFNAILNNRYRGLIFFNEIFQPLRIGSRVKGYVKTIREDKGIDVKLQKQGYHQVVDEHSAKILQLLRQKGGFIPLTDSSEPGTIYLSLEMSKKNFKKALGALYRERLIQIKPDGTYLVTED